MLRLWKIINLILSGILLFIYSPMVFAQNPVKWSLAFEGGSGKIESGKVYKIKLLAEIEKGWHLYALEQPKGGPIATTVKLPERSNFTINGNVTSNKPIIQFDPNFEIETKFFKNSAEFRVPLKTDKELIDKDVALDVRYQLCTDKLCLPPKTTRVTFEGFKDVRKSTLFKNSFTNTNSANKSVTNFGQNTSGRSVWSFIWLAITLGALSLLTPCVFPMIPITISYFTKNSDGSRTKSFKLALVYSLGIVATFTLLGMLLAFFIGAAGINLFAANPWVNILIAAIFLFFALNLFGLYEIKIPTSVLTKLDTLTHTKEGEGSDYIGALLMGLAFTITSFTCTSPFIGTILVSTSQGEWKMPLIGSLAFSIIFTLPFFVLALVPKFVSQLPKSGGWLNSVKVVMGFLEIAAALKFLSNVDLVWTTFFTTSSRNINYGTIFSRETVLILWVIISIAIVLYILGVFKFKSDSPVKKITTLRILFASGFLGLSFYLVTGILGRRLGELESFLPPKNAKSSFNVLGNQNEELEWISNDFEKALFKARVENKKIFVDFTGYTCTNCRWMETNMFTLPEVRDELEKYVCVSLYTDGEGEIYYKQQQFQEKIFKTVALPFYAIFDANGKPTATFAGLTRNSDDFIDFLRESQ